MNTRIVLSNSQIIMAATAGVLRQLQYIDRHKKNNEDGSTASWMPYEQGWTTMIEGALSEYALSKYLNLHWEGTGVRGEGDVGIEEARVTSINHGSLVIRKWDKPNRRYWLLTGSNGIYIVRGFFDYQDNLPDKFLDDKGNGKPPAWFIPQSFLVEPSKYQEYVSAEKIVESSNG